MLGVSTVAKGEDGEIPGAPHLIPEDTFAYLRVDSAEEFRELTAASSMGQMLADPKLKPFASDVFRTLSDLFSQVSNELGLTLEEMLAIPSGQVAAAVMPGNISEHDEQLMEQDSEDESPEALRRRIARKRRQQNSIASVFIIDAGKNVDDLLTVVERIENRLIESGYVRRPTEIGKVNMVRLLPPRAGRAEIEYFERDDVVVFGIGHQTASKVLEQWLDRSEERTLADRADFASVMSRCVGAEDTRPQMTYFLDPFHLAERLVKRGGAAAFVWPIVEELGIGKIRGIGGSSFSGGEVFEGIMHMHVLIDPPRDGFFGVLRPQTGETSPPTWIPADVSSYTSIHWDFETTFDNVGKILEKFQGPEPLKRFVEDPVKQKFDISFREELLQNLTGRYVSVRWIEPPIKLNSQIQFHAFQLNDPLVMKETIAKFREKRPNELKVESVYGTTVYMGRQRGKLPANFRKPQPNLVIIDDWVCFSDSRAMTERIIRAKGGGERLLNVPEFELVSSELGGKLDGEKPFMVSFLRGADYIRQMYDLIQSPETRKFLRGASEKNPMVGKLVALLERNELPEFEEFEKYFAPSGTFAYDEPTGMHLGTFTLRADQ
jgi:hypothetical protein